MSTQHAFAPRFQGLWRHRDFMRLWAGQSISVFGSLLTRTALPFTAILALHAAPLQMAFLSMADTVPGLLFGLVAGAAVDRLRRRPVLVAADLARAALLASVPAAALLGVLRLEHLYVVALLAGASTVFFDVAYLSYLPTLISRDRLLEGNSKLAASASVAETGAFMASGWLVQWLTAPFAILVDSVTFLVSAISLIAIRAPEPEPTPVPRRPNLRIELLEGLGELWRSPPLRAVAAGTATQEFSLGVGSAVFMLFVTRDLGFKPSALGMIFAVGGLSSLLGAAVAAPCTRRFGHGPAMMAGLMLSGIATLLAPLARDASLIAALLLIGQQAIGDGAAVVYAVSQVTVRQALAPDHLQGRIHAGYRFLGLSATLLGALAGGLVAECCGLRVALVMGGLVGMAASLWFLRSPARGFMQGMKVGS